MSSRIVELGAARPRALRGFNGFQGTGSTDYRRLESGTTSGTTSTSDYMQGNDSNFAYATLFRFSTLPGTSTRILLSTSDGSTAGFRLNASSTAGLIGQVVTNAGVKNTNSISFTSGDLAKVHGAVVIWDKTNGKFRIVVDKNEIGVSISLPGSYLANNNTTNFPTTIGTGSGGGGGASNTDIFGIAYCEGLLTVAEAQAWFDKVKICRNVTQLIGAGTTANTYRVLNPAHARSSNFAMYDSQLATGGSDTKNLLSTQGSSGTVPELTAIVDYNPTWAW